MRLRSVVFALPVLFIVCAGCPPQPADPNSAGLITAVAGITESGATTPESPAVAQAAETPTFIKGSLTDSSEYQMIHLGSGVAGEETVVQP